MKHSVALIVALALLVAPVFTVQPQVWPSFDAKYVLEPIKTAGGEMTDPFWLHLHHMGPPVEQSFSLRLMAWSEKWQTVPNSRDIPLMQLPPGHEVQYTVRGIPLSPWLPVTAADYTVTLNNPALAQIQDGIHDLSVDVRGPNRGDFQPLPMYLHIHRMQAVAPTVPLIARDDNLRIYAQDEARQGPGVAYVNVANRQPRGYPAIPTVTPWHLPPYIQENLYLEEMSPHGNLFMAHPMWWEEPPGTGNAGLKFVRGLPPKFAGEDARALYANHGTAAGTIGFGNQGHRTFPFRDGPRGIGWASPYISGQVDSIGGFAFVETGGPLRYMKADGEIITVAGWRVRPDKDPVWILKPLTSIRQNMELRGNWQSGQYADQSGFRLPLDVAIDPRNENIWYVAGFHDHAIWKVEITDRATMAANVSVFAGDPNHSWGYVNGTGTAARFKGPGSLVFDPVSDAIYVADQDNDAIRKITRSGVVTTVFGAPGMGDRICTAGGTNCAFEAFYDSQRHNYFRWQENRQLTRFTVSAAQAATGVRPDIYIPYVLRVDSTGNLILYDAGYRAFRRLNPATGETVMLGDLAPTLEGFPFTRPWVWLDVDRWGNTGPRDGIYFASVVGSPIEGEPDIHFNEVFGWIGPQGGPARWVFGPDELANPDGWGAHEHADAPHYPWLVAVDPRGALLTTGIGEHGISRLRLRRPTDPVPTNYNDYYAGDILWWRLINPWTKQDYSRGYPSLSLKFGWGGHNHLGFADAWGTVGRSDAELVAMFEIPASIQSDPGSLWLLLQFIRYNSGVAPPNSPRPPSAVTGLRIVP